MPWERWARGGGGSGALWAIAAGAVGGVGLVGGVLDGGRAREGGAARRSWCRFRPIAQISSHEVLPVGRPWVRQSQAMSQARKVMPSTKEA